jgi:hypothetical protein
MIGFAGVDHQCWQIARIGHRGGRHFPGGQWNTVTFGASFS